VYVCVSFHLSPLFRVTSLTNVLEFCDWLNNERGFSVVSDQVLIKLPNLFEFSVGTTPTPTEQGHLNDLAQWFLM
jgi:hypothetical protein